MKTNQKQVKAREEKRYKNIQVRLRKGKVETSEINDSKIYRDSKTGKSETILRGYMGEIKNRSRVEDENG